MDKPRTCVCCREIRHRRHRHYDRCLYCVVVGRWLQHQRLTDQERDLAESWLRLAYKKAHRWHQWRPTEDREVLANVAEDGLLQAAKGYTEGLGWKPGTYLGGGIDLKLRSYCCRDGDTRVVSLPEDILSAPAIPDGLPVVEEVDGILDLVEPEDRDFLCRKFGLGGYQEHGISELAKTAGLTVAKAKAKLARILGVIQAQVRDREGVLN